MPDPDLSIYNTTSVRPVVFAHGEAGRTLLAEHYGLKPEEADWICIDLAGTAATRRFREFHGRLVAACLRPRRRGRGWTN